MRRSAASFRRPNKAFTNKLFNKLVVLWLQWVSVLYIAQD